jgi:uncharacterized protein (TIGR02284 family)
MQTGSFKGPRISTAPRETSAAGMVLGGRSFETHRRSEAMTFDSMVKVLNQLIRTSADGEQDFAVAAEKADDPYLKDLFQDRAQACGVAAGQLRALVRAFGVEPACFGTVAGAVHRGWIKARRAVGRGDDDLSVLESIEHDEDKARAAYASALDTNLPADVMSIVSQQYLGVVNNHNQVRDLRDELLAGT